LSRIEGIGSNSFAFIRNLKTSDKEDIVADRFIVYLIDKYPPARWRRRMTARPGTMNQAETIWPAVKDDA